MSKEKQDRFLELFEALKDQLFMYAKALESSYEDAEDLVYDTILACYENFDKMKDLSGFKGYVFKTARSKFRQKYRRSWLWGSFNETKAENLISNDFRPDIPLEIEILYKALDKLPEKQKEAIVLFEISGFSIEEIKDIQGGTLSGVKSRLKRGREMLTELLTDNPKITDYNLNEIETQI